MSRNSYKRVRRDGQRAVIRAYDLPPEILGLPRWAGGFWWRLRRVFRRES